jgi:hypothetical protein
MPRREESSAFGGHRIERILGRPPITHEPISTVVDLVGESPGSVANVSHIAAYIDATSQSPAHVSDGVTAVHVLWTEANVRGEILAGLDFASAGDLVAFDAHPGDTLLVPARTPFALGAGMLAFVFGSHPLGETADQSCWSREPLPHPPTHGLQIFAQYNRRTICAAHDGLLLERWKITTPLDLTLNPRNWHYLTNLVEPVALNWSGGSELLGRTESRFLPAGLSQVSIVPDGLGYVLIGSIPDLTIDVIDPLRSAAGYDRSAIASLGVPLEMLG